MDTLVDIAYNMLSGEYRILPNGNPIGINEQRDRKAISRDEAIEYIRERSESVDNLENSSKDTFKKE